MVRVMLSRIISRTPYAVILIAILSLGVGYVLPGPANAQEPPTSAAATPSPQRAILDVYCVGCHNETLKTAGLTLDILQVEHVGEDPVVWEKVAKKLRTGAMPPPGMLRPAAADYDSLATYLGVILQRQSSVITDTQ